MKSSILFIFLSFPLYIIQKLQGIYRCSADEMTALQSEMFSFWFRVPYELQLASYSSKHAPCMVSFLYTAATLMSWSITSAWQDRWCHGDVISPCDLVPTSQPFLSFAKILDTKSQSTAVPCSNSCQHFATRTWGHVQPHLLHILPCVNGITYSSHSMSSLAKWMCQNQMWNNTLEKDCHTIETYVKTR